MRNPWRKSDSLVGLDIGSTSVKLLELSQHDGHHRVEAFGVEPLPPNAVVDRNISDPERVGEAIRRVARRARPRTRRAAAAVPDSAAITKTIEMDASLSDDALLSRIVADAGRHIPFPLDDVAMDFEVRNLSERNPDQVEVLLAACRREDVEKREAAMRRGGFGPGAVEIEGHAMQRACSLAHSADDPPSDGLLGVVDIGADTTRLRVFDRAGPVYFQEQRCGGEQLCADVRRRHGLSREDALRAVRQRQSPADGEPIVVDGFRTSLVTEICRALRLFRASSDRPLAGLLLAGGGAALEGLDAALADAVGTRASLAAPLAGMSCAPRIDPKALASSAPALLTACGLALRGLDV